VTLGGRRVQVKRPRVRTADGESEVPLVTYDDFADRDQLGEVLLEGVLAGVSTRQYGRTQEPVGEGARDRRPAFRGASEVPRSGRARGVERSLSAGLSVRTRPRRNARAPSLRQRTPSPATAVWWTNRPLHHAFPTSYRHGLQRRQIDPSAGSFGCWRWPGSPGTSCVSAPPPASGTAAASRFVREP
jgi:hypothetical protein